MHILKILVSCMFLLAAAAGAVGCNGASQTATVAAPETASEPTRRQLQRRARQASVWRFVYCLEDEADPAGLKALLHEIAAAQPFGKRIEVVSCNGLSLDTLGSGPLNFFGNRLPAGAERLPLTRTPNGWRFVNDHEIAPDEVLLIPYYRNPWPGNPTVAGFYLSTNPIKLVERLREEYVGNFDRMFWPNWAYELYRANGDRTYGAFADTSWNFDPAAEITLKAPDKAVYDQDGLQVFAYDGVVLPPEVDYTVATVQKVRRLTDALFRPKEKFFPEIRLYPNLERIGLRTGRMDPVQYDAEKKVLHLVPSFVPEDDLLASSTVWRAFIGHHVGGVKNEGAWPFITAFVQGYAGEDLGPTYTADKLMALRMSTRNMFNPHAEKLFELASPRWSRSYALAEFSTKGDLQPPLNGYIDETFRELEVRPVSRTDDAPLDPVAYRPMNKVNLAGMTFAHQGYRIHNGYGGEKIKPSLDSLAALSVNALAVVPYTFMRDPTKPTELPIPQDAGGENDWATICSLREAAKRGWFTLLKPQIWIGGGHWPGDVTFTSDEDWDTFFSNYEFWIMHYALLAEREGVDALCLGTELVRTTVEHPDRWKTIIAKVRAVYGGQLTYAANWGEEFENFTFWDELDAIGLNSYYPISEKDDPTDEELLDGARRWFKLAAEVSKQVDRPLWLTEVGYRSVAGAWKNPHAESNGRDPDNTTQARCYHAMLSAAGETPELKGMFLWKWPSYLGIEGYRHQGTAFTPGGKSAAGVLQEFNSDWSKQ